MKVAVVGATGLVGREMVQVLSELNFPVSELIPVASEKSLGKTVAFSGRDWKVITMEEGISRKPDFALFSAGGAVSREWAPRWAEAGVTVIDNSSAWRMEPNIPLVVPEINAHTIGHSRIIANPNCSTIQMVMTLAPLHRKFGIDRIVVSTYQSVSGTGKDAVEQLMNERKGLEGKKVYPQEIDLNCIPQCDIFLDNGYTREEMKMVNETRKILGDQSLRITSTTVRVPVIGGHSESVNVTLKKDFSLDDIRETLASMPGVVVMDDPSKQLYPTPKFAKGKNEVFVGRIRIDESEPRALNLWIVSDNLRKGAATNAVQIAHWIVKAGMPVK